ncbi:2-isopropylmalate synthase [Patescibacteria group bacterium]|nr:2-isopropylmalate synthase [Patescibacteria group bacterium]MBU4512697.1 2-isopropylmalate synthase [Patescibacteria group bacterium]MCG2693599.1 2-isopropylmalate synthase [Candidatus Parcubacteria bacterium]
MVTEKVYVFDTSLRDGEQAAGSRLGAREKLGIAQQLARLRVDIIEAGFPVSSPGEFEAVRLIAQKVEGPVICALARALPDDIIRAADAVRNAYSPRIHTFIGTSPQHMDMLKRPPHAILGMAVESVERARSFCEDVEFSPMDATRTEFDYLCEVIEAAIGAGATIINIPDTVGYAQPQQFGALIKDILRNISNIQGIVLSVHCHNDLGLAVANTLAAVDNGARQVECTINGIGERAGNAALEEVVMAIRTRRDYYSDVATGIDTREIVRASRLVADAFGMIVPANKAIVGANAFAHSSGIHQDGFLKNPETFEIIKPEDVGLDASKIVLTARSGRHALQHRLEQLGYYLSDEELGGFYETQFLPLSDKKKEVYDEDLIAMMGDEMQDISETYHLKYLHTSGGTGAIPTATVQIQIRDEVRQKAECGDGPVDATFKAIQAVVNLPTTLQQYAIRSVTSGTEAMGEVTVHLKEDGNVVIGRGVSTDIIEASAKAYIDGLNKLAVRKKASVE